MGLVKKTDGPTPNGGVRSEAWFQKADGSPAETVKEADRMVVIEFAADGKEIVRQVFDLEESQAPSGPI